MTAQAWHDFLVGGGALLLFAVAITISPIFSRDQTLRFRLTVAISVVAFIMAIILVANLL